MNESIEPKLEPPGVLTIRFFHFMKVTLGGAMGIRTPDLLNAIEALYQLSYDPKCLIQETKKISVMEVRS